MPLLRSLLLFCYSHIVTTELLSVAAVSYVVKALSVATVATVGPGSGVVIGAVMVV